MNITLRIKRKYFDQILNGSKTVEYRDCKPYYDRLFQHRDRIETLTLHYQRGPMLRADVRAINRIRTPDFFRLDPEEAGIGFGQEVYAILLENPMLIRDQLPRRPL